MQESPVCPKCGAELDSDAPAGLCPKCLVVAGFESEELSPSQPAATAPSPAATGWEPPTVERLAALFPQLEILELLGRGGMGAVYKARQPGLDRLVAVKILPPEVGHDPAFAERFTREARALAHLSHPNIVAVHDFGQADGLFFFVMEYVDGLNLRQTLQAGKLTAEEALAIVPQICDALQYAHDEGVVHRDIKPENILLDKRGRLKIADFGLSKLLGEDRGDDSLTRTQQVMGTLRYMAPEQMQASKAVDHRADIYSLGVVFYELLTGEVPMGRFDPPSKHVQVDVRLDEVVLRALDREPDKRYQQASAIKTDVESISTSKIASARESITGYPELPAASDAVFARRMMWIIGLFWVFWAGLWVFDLVSYISGAEWYFEDGIPKEPWNWVLFWTSAMLLYFVVYWWYTLAKLPDTARSLSDFLQVCQSPDRRTRWWFTPAAIYAAVFLAVMGPAMAFAGDSVQATIMYLFLIAAPLAFVASSVWIYGLPPRDAEANAASPQQPMRASATSSGNMADKSVDIATPRNEVKIPAIGLIVVGVLTLLSAPLLILAAAGVWAMTPAAGSGGSVQPPEPMVEEYRAEPLHILPDDAIQTGPEDNQDEVQVPMEAPADGVVSPIRDQLRRDTAESTESIDSARIGPSATASESPEHAHAEIESHARSGDAELASAGPAPWLIVTMILSLIVVGLPSLVVGVLIISGGWRMLLLNSYGLAITASILALFPCQPLFLLGLIFGIWSLVVLSRPHVKAAFEEQAGKSAGGDAASGSATAGKNDASTSSWADWWRSRPAALQRAARWSLVAVYFTCFLMFFTFHFSGQMVFAPGHEEESTYRGTIGYPVPWYVVERSNDGQSSTIKLLSPTLLLIVLAMAAYGLYFRLRVVETRGNTSRLEQPTVATGVWVAVAALAVGLAQLPLFVP